MANDGEYGNIMFPFAIKGGAAAAGYPKKPTAPTGLSADVNTTYGNAILSWTAPVNTGFPTVTSYTVEVVGVTTINTGSASTSYTWTGGTKGTAYNFKVYANNSAGQSPASAQAGAYTIQGNVATGGSVSDVSNYNGTGQTWRVHTFTGSSNLVVSVGNNPFSVMLIAGGGSGGGSSVTASGIGGGGGGGVLLYGTQGSSPNGGALNISPATYPIVIGGGAAAGQYAGQSGGDTTFNGYTAIGGGGGAGEWRKYGLNGGSGGGKQGDGAGGPGSGTAGQGTNGSGYFGGSGLHMPTTIRGSSETFAQGTGVSGSSSIYTSYGSGGQAYMLNQYGASGYAGAAIIAYRLT